METLKISLGSIEFERFMMASLGCALLCHHGGAIGSQKSIPRDRRKHGSEATHCTTGCSESRMNPG
jgi:hypothetical protein